jgi:hypothetical protein
MAVETVESRYAREWLGLKDDRKVRGYDERSEERRSRDFVPPADVAVDADGVVTGTAGDKHDNVPAGFNVSTFEADLVYLPDRDGVDDEEV